MAIDPTQIALTLEQQRRLAELAEQTGKSWPEVLTEALRTYHPRNNGPRSEDAAGGTFYEAMKDIIGIVREAPAGLSTDPQYMEGFGRDRDTSAD